MLVDVPDQLEKRDKTQNSVFGPVNILLAEDNAVNQIAAAMFEDLGHNVSVAENGKEALMKLEKEKFDIIFMDIEMPELDGLEATRIIRAPGSTYPDIGKYNSHIPIIAMSAHALKGVREQCIEAGMNDYISKPFKIKDLTEKIERYTS